MFDQNFYELSREKILKVIKEEMINDKYVRVELKTVQFNRVTYRPHIFYIDKWKTIKERGYVE